jgi:hypothetical protein
MNFTGMPFTWNWLFWTTIAATVITPLAMLVWFFKNGWIGEGEPNKGLSSMLSWFFPKR